MKKIQICLALVFLANIIWGQNVYTTPEQVQIHIDICSLLSQDKNTEALNLIKREISKCEQETVCDTEHYANMLYLLATYDCKQKDYDAAYAHAQKALCIFSKVDSPIYSLGFECAKICMAHFCLKGDAAGFAEFFSTWTSMGETKYGSLSLENEELHIQTCLWLLKLKFADALRLIVDESYDCFVAVKSNLSQDVSLIRSTDYSTIFKYLGQNEKVLEIYENLEIQDISIKQSQNAQVLCTLYYNAASIYEESVNWDKVVSIYEAMDDLFPSLTSDEQELFFDLIYPNLAYAYSRVKKFQESISLYDKCLLHYKDQPDQLFCIYNNLGLVYDKKKDFAKAVDCFEKAIMLFSKSNRLKECAPTFINLAGAYAELGQYTRAEEYANKALRLYGLQQRKDKVAHCYDVLASIYSGKGDHRRERHAYIEAASNYQEAFNTQSIDLNTLLRAANAFGNADDLENRIAVYEKIVEFFKAHRKDEPSYYLHYDNKIIQDLVTLGKSGTALRRIEADTELVLKTFGEMSIDYAAFLETKAIALHSIAAYKEEVEVLTRICDILENLSNQIRMPQIYIDLAMAYQSLGEYKKAQDYLNKVLKHPETSDTLKSSALLNMTVSLMYQGQLSEAQDAMEAGYKMSRNLYEDNSYDYCIDQYFLATIFTLIGGYDEACKIFKNIEKVYTSNCEPFRKLEFYNDYYLASQNSRKTNAVKSSTVLETLRTLVSNNLPLLSPKERGSFLKAAYKTKNVLFRNQENISAAALYDCALLVKCISTGTSINVLNAVENSNNQALKSAYDIYRELQKDISYVQSRGGVVDKGLIRSYNSAENNFLTLLDGYNELKALYHLTCSDIKAMLPDKSCAVEFVAYSDGNDICYSAVILEREKSPYCIKLFTSSELSSVINDEAGYYSLTDSAKHDLSELIWGKILTGLNNIKTIYFSPDAYLNNIPVEFLPNPCGGGLMSESYKMMRLSTTRNISSAYSPSQYKRACIYGGLDYNLKPDEIAVLAERYSKNDNSYAPADTLRGGWGYLPGTKKETEIISNILSNSGLTVSVFSGAAGCEESIKSVNQLKPDILHIATHGFYIPKNVKISERDDNHAMTRSGLIMSRSQDQNQTNHLIEDGILTAAEIECINLYNTQLAVLSACESGLGDITDDGVIGLQSAFKVAGVRTILLSLWKVDDNATQLMMTVFYKTLMQTGNKRDAFETARIAVREKYPDPYYWAGFIMLD